MSTAREKLARILLLVASPRRGFGFRGRVGRFGQRGECAGGASTLTGAPLVRPDGAWVQYRTDDKDVIPKYCIRSVLVHIPNRYARPKKYPA